VMSRPRIIYRPRPDVEPQGELNALADVYAFVWKCGQEKKKAGVKGAGDEAKGPDEYEVRPTTRILPH
jgi:hypothetical protein